jgi:hypothetical protein
MLSQKNNACLLIDLKDMFSYFRSFMHNGIFYSGYGSGQRVNNTSARYSTAELRFSMAEDISKDMPAAPVMEKVTENMLVSLKKSGDRL